MSDDYDVMPAAESLAEAHRLLARLDGINATVDLEQLGRDLCRDCAAITTVYRYGRLELCRHCATLRACAARRETA